MNNLLAQSPLHDTIEFKVPAFATGPHGALSLPHLIRILQEAAMQNSVRLKISSPEMIKTYGCSWVVRRQRVDVKRWPVLGEDLLITTAPSGFARNLQTFRDFHLQDKTGQIIITAATEWLLMDISTRRLKTIPPSVTALEDHLAPAAAHLNRPNGKIPPPDKAHFSKHFEVAFSQLDFNDHLTNPVFPELMLEPLGHDFLSKHLPSSADIMFHKEARYGDRLEAVAGLSDGTLQFRHALLRNGEPLATMRTFWEKTSLDSSS